MVRIGLVLLVAALTLPMSAGLDGQQSSRAPLQVSAAEYAAGIVRLTVANSEPVAVSAYVVVLTAVFDDDARESVTVTKDLSPGTGFSNATLIAPGSSATEELIGVTRGATPPKSVFAEIIATVYEDGQWTGNREHVRKIHTSRQQRLTQYRELLQKVLARNDQRLDAIESELDSPVSTDQSPAKRDTLAALRALAKAQRSKGITASDAYRQLVSILRAQVKAAETHAHVEGL